MSHWIEWTELNNNKKILNYFGMIYTAKYDAKREMKPKKEKNKMMLWLKFFHTLLPGVLYNFPLDYLFVFDHCGGCRVKPVNLSIEEHIIGGMMCSSLHL